MAITYLASKGYNNRNQGGSVLPNPTGINYLASKGYVPTSYAPAGYTPAGYASSAEDDDKNRGGLFGGLGYLVEKVAVGAVSSVEGIFDYTFSGLAKLFGNDAWAEDIIENDWFGDWYSHPEEWFNPGQGWQVAGDVAGGIGSSVPALAAGIGLTAATGGLAAPVAAAIVGGGSGLVSGLGAAGRATKEAYEQTGELTGKEYGYGALVGATEGTTEGLFNLIGLGSGAVVKGVSKAIGKETAEAFAKQGILKTLRKSFVGEAMEEGFSEWITPYWQKVTYDPKAKDASLDEILYASLVGGLSGVAMGGGGYVYDNVKSFAKGNKLTISGGDAQVLATAGDFASFEELNQTGDKLFLDIANKRKSLLESLSKTNGKAVTIQQKRDLGALERANIAGSINLFVARRAQNIVNNAPSIAERLTAFGYKTADGKPITYTAEELTAGYDPKRPSSIYKAIKTNEKLRSLAVADATGRLMMDTNQFKKNALMGEKLASQVDINRFYEQASREELQAVTDALKIESWSELTPEIFNQKITDFINDGGVQRTLEAKERKAAFAALTQEGAQKVPKIVNLGKDGMRRYTDGQLDIAVERKGDKYTLYNYKTDNLSKEMKREDINKFFRDYSNQKEEYLAAERERLEVEQKRRAEFEGIETMLRDKVSEYKTLNAPNQSMIRRLVREGRAKGVSDSDILMYAKVSAHSGIDIQFDKEANYRGTKENGSADYADGFYEAAKNRIVVNPEGKRTAERLLIHELDHAIRKYFDSEGKPATRIYLDAIEGVDQATRDNILEAYKKTAKPGEVAAVVMDETNAYYAEQVLGNRYTLEKLIEAEPTLKDKILSFFKGASTDYADVPKLSGAAKKYYRTYKKLFDEFSARNAENNAIEPNTNKNGSYTNKNGVSDNVRTTDDNSGKDYAIVAQADGKVYVKATRKVINSNTLEEQRKEITHFFDVLLESKSSLDIPTIEGDVLTITKANTADKARDNYKTVNDKRVKMSKAEFKVKLNAEAHIDELAEISKSKPGIIPDSKNHLFAKDGFTYRTAYFEDFDGKYYRVTLSIGNNGTVATVYNVGEMKKNVPSSAKIIAVMSSKALDETFSNSRISQTEEKSNSFDKKSSDQQDARQYALSFDEDNSGRKLTSEQAEYFKDSKARDKRGRLLVLYHGTNANFNTFKKGDVGFHFGTKGAARGRAGYGKNAIIKEVYLRITNPIAFDEDLGSWDADYRLTQELVDIGILTKAEAENVLMTDDKRYKRTTEAANKKLAGLLLSKGYDGIEYKNTFETKNPTTSYIVFNSNQAKEITNNFPTNNPDIRYALDIDSEEDNISGAEVMSWLNKKPEMTENVQKTQVTENVEKTEADKTNEDKPKKNAGYKILKELKTLKSEIIKLNVDPYNVMAVSDGYFERYDGKLSRTALRIRFLEAAKDLASENSEGMDKAYNICVDIAEEVLENEKDTSGYTEHIKDIKAHIREIQLKIDNRDKADFDSYGGFAEFRKRNFGNLRLENNGMGVDVVYMELQNLYGYDLFPNYNSIAEMVNRMATIDQHAMKSIEPTNKPAEEVQAVTNRIYLDVANAIEKGYSKNSKKRVSRADAEKYIEYLNAKYKVRLTQARLKIQKRAEKQILSERSKIENEKVRLKADYETDRVYNQETVEQRLYDKIEQFKYLKKDIKEGLIHDLWQDLNESNGAEWRKAVEIEYTVKIVDEILHNPNSGYDFTNPSDRQRLNNSVSEVISGITKTGRLSEKVKLEKRLMQEAKTEANAKQRILNNIHQTLKKIDDKKNKRFMSASSYRSTEFKNTVEALTKIDWRGNFSTNIAKDLMSELREWYSADNEMLFPPKRSENDFTKATAEYDPAIAGRLLMLSKYDGNDYGVNELKALDEVISYFVKLVDEYDKVYIEGKWQDGEPLARELVDIVKKQDKVGVPIVVRALRNKLLSAGFRTFGDALSVMKLADMYGDGLFTRYYNEWLQGEINADAEAMKIKEKYDAFMKENSKFLKNAETETVKLHGIDVRKIDLISYAMTLKRKQAWESIAEGGVVFRDPKDGRGSHIYPTAEVVKGEGYSKRLEATMQAELDNVMSMLTEKDVQYMKVLEAGFELARTTKAMGDMQRYGFVSVIDGYYYPIKHEYTSHLSAFDVELIATDRYANASFNKSQTEGAKSAIRISSADATFNSHVKGVSRYLYLSPVMDSFNKLYKLQLSTEGNGDIITSDTRGNSYSLQSVIDQSKTAWRQRQDGKLVGFDYLQNLMLDTMGMGKNVGDDFAARLRGAAVTFSLGANPKVLVTQLSSLISSTSILSWGSHAKAIGVWGGNVDNYSVVAKLRNSDYTVAKAEGVIDRINTWSRVFTAGISLMDRFVVNRAFAACQIEVAKNKGPAIGSEENRIAAGKLLDKVILETQQNSLTSRRTEGARRGNIITKQMQMYKSDAITSFGRAVDGWGEMNYLGALLKSNALSDAERGTIQNRFTESQKKLAKAIGSIVGQAAFMMLVTEIFRNFYGKNDDETEEEKRTRLVVDAIGNLVNGVPVVSEVVSAITSNFGFETMEFSALNDFFDTAKGVIDYTEKKLEGKATERDGNKLMQNLLYTAGQLTGVPTRNMKNVSYGVVRLFSKDAAYKWDNAIYKKNYSADLNEAVAKGDMNRATMIMELALGEKLGSGFSTEAIGELTRLAGLGEKIIPGAISDTITVDGEEFVLNGEQYEAVKAEYDKVISAVNSFIESKFYNSLTDDQRAKALRKLYSTYKDVSYDRALGTQKNPKANLISSLLNENVFNAYLTLGVIESDKDSTGNTISGSKRAKIVEAIGALGVTVEERLLLICASGYALKDGDIRGVSAEAAKKRLLKYILNLSGLSADEKAEIAVMCGFEVKNGKIINNFSKKSAKNLQKMSKVSPTRPKFVL